MKAEMPQTEAGRVLLASGSFPEDEGKPTWWSPGDLTPDVMRQRILAIENEAFRPGWQHGYADGKCVARVIRFDSLGPVCRGSCDDNSDDHYHAAQLEEATDPFEFDAYLDAEAAQAIKHQPSTEPES